MNYPRFLFGFRISSTQNLYKNIDVSLYDHEDKDKVANELKQALEQITVEQIKELISSFDFEQAILEWEEIFNEGKNK